MQLLQVLLLLASASHCHGLASNFSVQNDDRSEALLHNAAIESRLARSPIHGMKKMSTDEGEKFFLDYWSFIDETQSERRDLDRAENGSTDTSEEYGLPGDIFFPRSFPFQASVPGQVHGGFLQARDFKCPTGTNACTSIGRTDRCCSIGDTCEIVKDTGSGDVGCCPKGKKCSNVVGKCPSPWTTCSEALGGGCCISGYSCVPGGCEYRILPLRLSLVLTSQGALISVVTVTINATTVVSTKTYSTVPQSSASSSSSDTTTASTENLVPPARPTGLTTSTHSTTSEVSICPTGFYACSAVYHGGCCQTGRDCDTTSCPKTRSTTFTSDGVTIVEPVTTGGSNSKTGKCATGWFQCSDTAGGGCCPYSWTCGGSCTAPSATKTIAKEEATAKSEGDRLRVGGMWLVGIVWMLWLEIL